MLRQRGELERRLAKSNAALAEQMERETKALQKVQEVLQLAEVAIAEKNAAMQREKDTKGLPLCRLYVCFTIFSFNI